MEDYKIGRRLEPFARTSAGGMSVEQNARRVSVWAATADVAGKFTLYAGTNNSGIPLGTVNMVAGGPGWIRVSLWDVGALITGPLFFDNVSNSLSSVIELFIPDGIERLIDANGG